MRSGQKIAALILSVSLACGFGLAEGKSTAEGYSIAVLNSSLSGLKIRFQLGDYRLEEVIQAGLSRQRISLKGAGENLQPGSPHLPIVSKLFALPGDFKAVIRITDKQSRYYEEVDLEVCERREGVAEGEGYVEAGGYYPSEAVSVSPPVIARSRRMAALDISPFRYDRENKKLEVIQSMEIEIAFQAGGGENPQTSRLLPGRKDLAGSLNSALLNPGLFPQLDNRNCEAGEYMIVLPDSSLMAVMAPLAEWKTKLGFNVTAVNFAEIGFTAADLRNYLLTAYQSWEHPPEYVLLVGDVDGDISLPAYYYPTAAGDSAVTDHPYSLLEGNDYFADVEVGRLSVRSVTELTAVVNKLAQYESSPWLLSGYLDDAFVLADTSAKNSLSVKQWSRGLMLDYGYSEVDSFYYFDTFAATYVAYLLSQGYGLVNFRGWGNWGGLTTAQVRNLSNISETGIVLGCAGGTNNFAEMESMGEAFLRAGSMDTAWGAVSVVGPSGADTYSKFDGTMDQGMMWGLFDEGIYRLSAAVNRGKLELWLSFPWNRGPGTTANSVECYCYIYNILGDPSLRVWRSQPGTAVLSAPVQGIPFGQNYVELSIADNQSQPIAGAVFVVQHQGAVVSRGVSDEEGMVNLPLPVNVSSQIQVTVSHPDYAPIATVAIPIAYQPGYIGCVEQEVNDDNIGLSSGNGDGEINPGETVELYLTLHNFGNQTVNYVMGTISCQHIGVAVLQAQGLYGNMGPLATAVNIQPYVLRVEDGANGEEILLEVRALGSTGVEYESQSIMELSAPEVLLGAFDFPAAVLDTIISPGESSLMIMSVSNNGGAVWSGLTCKARSHHPLVMFTDSLSAFPACAAGGSVNNQADAFFITVSQDVANGYLCDVELFWQYASGQTDTMEITLPIGIATLFDPVMGIGGYGYYCFDDKDVTYDNSPDYEWREIDPDFGGQGAMIPLVDGAAFRGDSEVLTLPGDFVFRYYGAEVTQLTVCSNGWLAAGSVQGWDYQNKPLPAAGEPGGMIAPFWDDLLLVDGGEVYYYYDAVSHRYIIEWSRVKNAAGLLTETFEVVICDADHYVTPTQDSPIYFYYYGINDADSINDYSTVGITNYELDGGVQYVYSRIFSPGADTLSAGSALLFTTDGGGRVGPPVLEFGPTFFDFTLQTNQADTAWLVISNSGEANLEYSLSVSLWEGVEGSGGPDAYGYKWIDSDEPGGNPINWIDITHTGAEITFPHNDSTSANLPMGFSFPFYGLNFGTIVLSANGWCSFTSHSSAWSNTPLPNSSAPENLVSAWWDDLNPLEDGQVFYWTNQTDSVIASYYNVEHYGTTMGDYTYQVILEKNGKLAFQYLTMGGLLNSATIGIQNSNKTIGLQMAYNQNYVHNNLRIDIQKPWLNVNPLSGELSEGESDSVRLLVSTQGLPAGEYMTEITLQCNDPAQAEPIIIPVNLTVITTENYVRGLRISLAGEGVLLEWESGGVGAVYRIYRYYAPFFTLSQAELIGETMEAQYLDEGMLGWEGWFYRVVFE